MFKIESYFGPLLMSYLNKYVKLEEESFKLSLWGGDVTFHNLELQYDILEDLMPLPIGFKSGQVHELNVHVPWTKLGSESVVITLNTVECILALKTDFIQKSKGSPNSDQKPKLERNIPPGYLKSYLVNIINNIHVKVNNLIIKFVEDDIVLSMNAKSLEYLPVTDTWSRGFIDFSTGNLLVHKLVQVSDLTVCLDQMDASGHIELYQEPILYRCSVECRFILRYQSYVASKPDFLKFNIKFDNLELNVTTSQMPMIRRLAELFYALYYNNINWDAVVGCGFSNQITKSPEPIRKQEKEETTVEREPFRDESETASWGSWAWSYVPSVFAYDENFVDDDSTPEDITRKKILIFGIYFDSMQINLKKSQTIKSPYGSQRTGRSQKTILFMTLKGNNIGLNVTSTGLGFFNVQLGCTDIDLANTGGICPCGQHYKGDGNSKNNDTSIRRDSLIHMGSPVINSDVDHDFYLTGSLFYTNNDDKDNLMNTLNKLNSICSQETYAALFSQEQCLDKFGALWFDYVYCMQIVKNDMDESQIDLSNLCNTDGIRESSTINLYLGSSICNVNSYSVHNLVEVTRALDISRYSSYFRISNNDERLSKVFYPTEDQVARIHEFIPIRRYNVSLIEATINIHTFIESHNVSVDLPILELKTKLVKFAKSTPMYPINLIDCVSVLSTKLLKESKDLLNKCYLSKELKIIGLSVSLLIQDTFNERIELTNFMRSEMIKPCDISFTYKALLYSESWKTAQFVNDEKIIIISNIKLELIPSHVKTAFVIVASNYSWLVKYFPIQTFTSNETSSMNRQLDDVTLRFLDPHSSLLESCVKNNYQDQTYELHIALPDVKFRCWKTESSYFIDAKISHETLFAYLKDPLSSAIIPVLDNTFDDCSLQNQSCLKPFCLLYCQIPTQTKPVNCAFSFHCQIGSINCMFSSQLISWFVFPVLDFDLDDSIRSNSHILATKSREGTIVRSMKVVSDTRSTADGNSRPQSPTILLSTFPVPGHPKSISILDVPVKKEKVEILSNGSGWWNMFKEGCSKYFFFLQSLDVCIKLKKSRIHIMTVTDSSALQSNVYSCNQWVEQFAANNQSSIFLITMTRLALINSQRKEYLDDNFEKFADHGSSFQHTKSGTFIESLPWELIFHDIQLDCVHYNESSTIKSKLVYDSILKPVSINCTLSATPKCSSPERLDTLYSISWGVHVDITEVQPTVKQIYLIKLLDFFVTICLKVSCLEFTQKHYQLFTVHYFIVKNCNTKLLTTDEKPIFRSKQQSVSTKSTIKSMSLSSATERKVVSSNYRIVNSKLETHTGNDSDVGFKLSFWVQCTLSQFQLIILLNDNENGELSEKNVCLVMQVDDVTGSIDVQEKFVEIKSKFGSIFCQLGAMENDEIISQTPILKSGSKYLSKLKDEPLDDLHLDGGNRHCLSAAIIRTTINNLSQRPLSTYHHFKDTESFKSYPTEFTGNFSSPADITISNQTFVTQISSIIEPFELIISSCFIEQCHKLTDTLLSIYLQFFHRKDNKYLSSNKINVSSIKLEPYFISEEMPKFHLLVKSSKIIMPCHVNKCETTCDSKECGNNCIILSWNKISLQPFSDNPISRPGVKAECNDEDNFTVKCDSTADSMESEQKAPNSLDDNRQFQLNITNCGIYSSTYSIGAEENLRNKIIYDITLPKATRYFDIFSTSTIHGQNPAFEWNNYSKMPMSFNSKKPSDSQLKPILKPIDIQIIFAGALYKTSDSGPQRNLLGGYGLEINVLTAVEFLIDQVTINSLKYVSTNLNKLFSYENIQVVDIIPETVESTILRCLDDWIVEKKLGHLVPCVPVNVLITTRKIQLLLLLQDITHQAKSSEVHGLCLAISQPHVLLYFKNTQFNKLELSLFDIALTVTPSTWSESVDFFDNNDQLNNWTAHQTFILAEMRTILKTKPGSLDMKTGVPKSFLTATFSDFYQSKASILKLNFARQMLLDIDISYMREIVGVISCLSPARDSKSSFANDSAPSTGSMLIPQYLALSAELVSIKFGDCRQFDCAFQFKFGKSNIKVNTLKNYALNNLRSTIEFHCDSMLLANTPKTGVGITNTKATLVLKPLKITGKCQFRKYRPNSVDRYWTSSELYGDINLSTVNISVDKYQLILMRNLIQITNNCLDPIVTRTLMSNNLNGPKFEPRVEMFYDDLRSERFQIHTKLNTDVSMNELWPVIAEDATVMFSNDGEDLAAMYWTYPETRFITSIEVKPVPFVFIEYKLTKDDNYEQLQVPCQLEYWNCSSNSYELYKRFHLSENDVERIDDFPASDPLLRSNQQIVASKSWRVVFDCYARYKKVDNENNISYSERAMLVYLSPLVLAASMKVDSCYAPFVVKNSFVSLTSPAIQIEFRDKEQEKIAKETLCRPFKSPSSCEVDCSIVDNTVSFTVSCFDLSLQYLLTGNVRSHISSLDLYIANPFVALKNLVLHMENIDLKLDEDNQTLSLHHNVHLDIGIIQAAIEQCSLRQIITTAESLIILTKQLLFDQHISQSNSNVQKLLFCNFLDRRIRVRQHQDSFNNVSDSSKVGGIGSGDAVFLKFLPTNYYKYHKNRSESVSYEPIKLTLGLCSELKGTVRWTEPVEITHLNYEEVTNSASNLRIWNIDSTGNLDTPICSNSSNLSNSYNARSLLLLHHQTMKGLNKFILMGNTMFNNLTTECVHVNFSLPTELSSGFSFNISPSTIGDITASIHINWRVVSFASPNNIFELSFRIGNDKADNIEYRSLTYRMALPRFDDLNKKYCHQHSIIKLNERRLENQVVTFKDHWRQILCTLEWFQLNEEGEMFLLMTLSPMVVCKNMMLHDVNLHVTWISEHKDSCTDITESVIIPGNGGLFKLINFVANKSIEVNSSFLNDSKLLFDKPLVLTEDGLLESVNQNFDVLYSADDCSHDIMRQCLANRISNIIDNSQLDPLSKELDNPYSILVTITPWILISNNTQMNLVLGFDRNIFLLEALTDFVPPQYNKPIKIGIAFDKEIFWSETFSIGNCILKQNDNEVSVDRLWSVVDSECGTDAYLQLNITVDKGKIVVPVTMRHTFTQSTTPYTTNKIRSSTRYNSLTIESSVLINNQTEFELKVVPISIAGNITDDLDSSVHSIFIPPINTYIPLSRFVGLEEDTERPLEKKWFLSVTTTKNSQTRTSFPNLVSILDFKKLSKFSENVTYSDFSYFEESKTDDDVTDFVALMVNSTLDVRTQRLFSDIFVIKSVPIKITNHTAHQLFINRNENNDNQTICVIRPCQSVPLWTNEFLLDLNKDGCAKFDHFQFRIRIGIDDDNETDWTDYFPISSSPELSSIDLITVNHKYHLSVNVDSSAAAKCHIHINDHKLTLNNDSIIPLNPSVNIAISVAKCVLSILESGANLELQEETLRLTLDTVNLSQSTNQSTEQTVREISVNNVQLDNKRYKSGLYDFAVVLYSINTDNATKFFRCRVETDSCNMHNIDLKFEQEMELFLENIWLYDMLRIFGRLTQCIITLPEPGAIPLASSMLLNLGVVNISSIPLIITIHAFLKIYVSCEATSLSLPKLVFRPSLMRLKTVQRKLYEHYVTAALVRCGWVMGSFELLGNPSGILHHLTTGLSNLVCSKNIDHGLLADFMLRIFTFCRYTTGGLVSSFTGIASSVSRNLDYLCLDNTHIVRQDSFRRQYQPNGLMHGFVQGISGFALSMLGAIAGLADHPLHDSQEALSNNSSVTLAILKGLGKGLVGVVTKPLSGTAELFAQTGRGLLRTTGITILRCHSLPEHFELTSSRSELLINDKNLLKHLIKDNDHLHDSRSDVSVCFWCGIATNCRQQIVLLFLTSHCLMEWHLDNSVRANHTVYSLADYNVSLCGSLGGPSILGLQRIDNSSNNLISTDTCRINAFLSEQVTDLSTEAPTSCSSSSIDSLDYVTVVTNNTDDNRSLLFTLDYPTDGLLNAITFLRLCRDSATDNIFG